MARSRRLRHVAHVLPCQRRARPQKLILQENGWFFAKGAIGAKEVPRHQMAPMAGPGGIQDLRNLYDEEGEE
jgi:hypothetical protein